MHIRIPQPIDVNIHFGNCKLVFATRSLWSAATPGLQSCEGRFTVWLVDRPGAHPLGKPLSVGSCLHGGQGPKRPNEEGHGGTTWSRACSVWNTH